MSLWKQIEQVWPAFVGTEATAFPVLRDTMHDFLVAREVRPRAFSHFGIVVRRIDTALAALREATGVPLDVAHRNWVETYQVTVARGLIEGVELEFIEPGGESFFLEALRARGDALQHVSYRVENIEHCLRTLHAGGVALVNEKPRAGSHGAVAFARPAEFVPIYLELTEPNSPQ